MPENGKKYYEIVGEAYFDGFTEGHAFEGTCGRILEDKTREFAPW